MNRNDFNFNIEINLRASSEKLQEIYDYWVTSCRIDIKQLWERYDAIDTEVTEVTEVETNVKEEPIEAETRIANLNMLESNTTEILETLENPQGSLDKFEVVYQVAESDDEISYESRKVYAFNHDHAKAIVSQDLQTQHLRYIITGVEEALVLDDLSDFSLEGHGEF